MKRKIIGRNVEPKCRYCAFGKPTPDEKSIICPKKGVLDRDAYCRRFRYDPLKRAPREAPDILTFSEEDFTLE